MIQKVLVVEDEPALLETLVYNLVNQGYEVHHATTGYEALDVARQEQPDLIVWKSCCLASTVLKSAAPCAKR